MSRNTLDQLVQLAQRLGDPSMDYVILDEGNTSIADGSNVFWINGADRPLAGSTRDDFLRVERKRALEVLDVADPDVATVATALKGARVDQLDRNVPSVETLLHAVCLDLEGVSCVAHTHPIPINAIACSQNFREAYSGRLFPDEVISCGPRPLLIPYVDPGVLLAIELQECLHAFVDEEGTFPATIILQNHGLLALGETPQDVENVTRMAVKSARILLGTYALGGPRHLAPNAIQRIVESS